MSAPPEYTNAAEVLMRVAQSLGTTPPLLLASAPQWQGICQNAAPRACGIVHRIFLAKKYTPSQIFDDPGMLGLASDVGVCQAYKQASLANLANNERIKSFCEDVQKELESLPLVDDSGLQDAAGAIGYGTMAILDNVNNGARNTAWDGYEWPSP